MFQKRPNLALGFILVYFLLLTVGMRNSNGADSTSGLKTAHEKSHFKRYTSHAELESYLKKLSTFSNQMKLSKYGKTYQGRNLPLVIFSKEGLQDPKLARETGRPIILIGANIHGDERTLRESVLVLMRELVRKDSHMNRLLDDLIIIITPSMNPDGFEASKEGSRKNALGVDMNRDYMKLEQVSLFQFVRNILHTWKPHLWVDGHNGGRFPYHLSYLCSTNAGVSKSLSGFCNKKLLPFITKRLKQKEYKSFYYQRGNKSFWSIGGHKTRIGRNYGGLINIISVLFESPNWQNKELGFKSGLVGLRAVLEFSSINKDKILNVTKSTKKKVVKLGKNGEGNIVVKMKY
ncbi:MAG: M14 family zinc carboxypeptidase, partial [Bdellovibrionota bacterium]|nr:M14 family zinc carboxypeptidase [Bdellovibrionota bacterium]